MEPEDWWSGAGGDVEGSIDGGMSGLGCVVLGVSIERSMFPGTSGRSVKGGDVMRELSVDRDRERAGGRAPEGGSGDFSQLAVFRLFGISAPEG